MSTKHHSDETTAQRLHKMQARLEELEETLRAIREGEVDAVVVSTPGGDRVFTLQGADHPYRVIVETINEGAATLTPTGSVLYANRRFAEMVDRPLEKLIGSRLHDIVPILEWSTLDQFLERAKVSPQKEEGCLLVTGGKLLPAYLSLSPLKGDDFQGFCMVVSDLTEQKSRQEQLAKTNELLRAEIAERKRAEDALRHTEELFQAFMNHTPALVFIKDEQGCVTFCNKKVEEIFGTEAQTLVGRKALDWLPGEAARSIYERDLAALSGDRPTEAIETIPSRKGTSLEFLMVRFPFSDPSGRRLLGGVGVDITLQRNAEAALNQLSGRLLSLQDEERRRIARELHDSTAQTLTALTLNLSLLESERAVTEGKRARKLLADSVKLAQDASNEVRNLSHLLHPPDLDNVGLLAAIKWHANQMAGVSGIEISVEVPAAIERLPQEIEIALFRIVQESLENVRRHSGSPVARVRLVRQNEQIVLAIEDSGHGVPAPVLTDSHHNASLGLGVAGMRERMRQLGGLLEIESGARGTTVKASVPIPNKSGQEDARRQRRLELSHQPEAL